MKNNRNLYTYGKELTIQDIFRNIGYAHKGTSQIIPLNHEEVKNTFVQYLEKNEQDRQRFDQYIDEFEQKRYMSPVELLVCTHYRDIAYVYNELFNRINQFTSTLSETSEWKYCRCYGNKNIKSLLVKRHLYQNSHEAFFHGNAVIDVAAMIKYHHEYYQWEERSLSDLFSDYTSENPLKQIELHLLAIYLLNPINYFKAVESYATNASDKTMIQHVIFLKRNQQWLIKMAEWTHENLTLDETD